MERSDPVTHPALRNDRRRGALVRRCRYVVRFAPMSARLPLIVLVTLAATAVDVQAGPPQLNTDAPHDARVQAFVSKGLPTWLATYQHLHAHPELSLHEAQTAALVQRELRKAGYEVHGSIGGHGVVGLLKNGRGPTLLIRGDMDALPVTEQTGLPYASTVRVKNDAGKTVGVMHACGHDVHVANLLGTAQLMASHRELWTGTLMIVAQPAEELGQGSSNMIAAGLFSRFPKPDYVLALHVAPELAAGRVAVVPGWAFANVDSVDITVFGRGGHGAYPHRANDPIVTAAHLVTSLQTLVSRRLDPQQPGVVTVGSFHGGTKHNVIPDQAHLQLTVRSYSETARRKLLDGIAQLARDTCKAFQCSKPPVVNIKQNHTPAVYNDPALTEAAAALFRNVLGGEAVERARPTMGGEDFARYARHLGVPGLMFRLGTVSPAAAKRSRKKSAPPLPSLHSSRFAPDAERALRTGVRAMSNLALSILRKPGSGAAQAP